MAQVNLVIYWPPNLLTKKKRGVVTETLEPLSHFMCMFCKFNAISELFSYHPNSIYGGKNECLAEKREEMKGRKWKIPSANVYKHREPDRPADQLLRRIFSSGLRERRDDTHARRIRWSNTTLRKYPLDLFYNQGAFVVYHRGQSSPSPSIEHGRSWFFLIFVKSRTGPRSGDFAGVRDLQRGEILFAVNFFLLWRVIEFFGRWKTC